MAQVDVRSRVVSFARQIAAWLERGPFALAMCALLAAAVLLPRLDRPGLWEPQERQLSDRIAPPVPAGGDKADKAPAKATPPAGAERCVRSVPADASARTLTARAIKWGRDAIDDSDGGRRLPLALLGLLTVLAAAGTAMRLAGGRAAVVTAIMMLAMPLLALQSRMLTSEIGTACGASLIVYALVALGHPRRAGRSGVAARSVDSTGLDPRPAGKAVEAPTRDIASLVDSAGEDARPAGKAVEAPTRDIASLVDRIVALVALAAGTVLGFYGGGALLGLVVPIGAVAVAGSLGVPLIGAIRRREPVAPWIPPALATLATIGLLALLAVQLYDLKTPYPGMTPPPVREVLGKAIVPTGCYSWALGGMWRPDDDLRMIFDSTFEQIAYGTYPWGLLAPIAMVALLGAADARRRLLGAVTLAWAGAAWVAGEVFQRKVGFTVYAGFPALAIACGTWLDGVLAGRARGEHERRRSLDGDAVGAEAPRGDAVGAEASRGNAVGAEASRGDAVGAEASRGDAAMPAGAKLIAVFALLGVADLGKDLLSFAERLTSLLVGNDAVPYPSQSKLLWVPTKAWVLVFGLVIATAFTIAMTAWRSGDSPRDRWFRRVATGNAIAAIGATVVLAAFWTALWQPRLALHLSSKAMFETYEELARPGDSLFVMGDLGQAPVAYTSKAPQTVPDRTQIISALARPERVFAIAPQTELCTLHREVGGKPYFVVDDRNLRSLLLSNRVDGTTDKNPLRTAILHEEPHNIRSRPKTRVVWDNRIELLGWDVPRTVVRGAPFEVVVYYKILQTVGGNWKALMHIDGAAGRAGNGDHDPINGRCPTSTWQPGDYIIDRFTTRVGGVFPGGSYEVWIGFFTGQNPNWRNMTVSLPEKGSDMRDSADRVKITTIGLD